LRLAALIGVLLAGIGVAMQSALYLVDMYVLDRSVELFDLEEGAIVTWAASSAAFAVAVVAALLALLDERVKVRAVVVAAGAAFLSFDDATYLHERIALGITAALDASDTYVQLVWPSLYFPLLAVVAVCLLRIATDTATAHRLVVAGLALLTSAVVLEVAALALERAGVDSWPSTVEVVMEEGVELAGWVLIATGVAVRLLAVAQRRDALPRAERAA